MIYKLILTNKSQLEFYVRECAEVYQHCYGGVIIEVSQTPNAVNYETQIQSTQAPEPRATGTWG